MRPIKFRGRTFPGAWFYGNLVQIDEDCRIQFKDSITDEDSGKTIEFYRSVSVDPSSIGQFTGLLDRNGKEIYEGDIITVNGRYPRVVLWDMVSWALMPCEHYHDKHFWVMNLQHPENDWWEKFADEMEIIGNIYDNPELMGNEQSKKIGQ